MTDKELDDLEARLPVIVETLASLNMDISLEAWNYISNNILSSAGAIAELREKNAGLENDIELAIILLGQAEPPRDDPDMEWAPLVHSLTSAYKENTQ